MLPGRLENEGSSAMTTLLDDAAWILSPGMDDTSKTCSKCKSFFNLVKKAHTCKSCHFKFCGACSRMKSVIRDKVSVNERACDGCIANMIHVSSIDHITDSTKPYILELDENKSLLSELKDELAVSEENKVNTPEKSVGNSTPVHNMTTLGSSPLMNITNNVVTPASAQVIRSPLTDMTNKTETINTPNASARKTNKLSTQKTGSGKKKISPEMNRKTQGATTVTPESIHKSALLTPTNETKTATLVSPPKVVLTPAGSTQSPSATAVNRISPSNLKKTLKKQSDIFKFKVYLGVLFVVFSVLLMSLIYKTVTTVIVKPSSIIDDIQLQHIDGSILVPDGASESPAGVDIQSITSDIAPHTASVIKIDNFVTIVSVIFKSNQEKIINFIKLSSPYSEYVEL